MGCPYHASALLVVDVPLGTVLANRVHEGGLIPVCPIYRGSVIRSGLYMSKRSHRNQSFTRGASSATPGPAQTDAAMRWYHQGLALQQRGRLVEAAQAYREAIKLKRRFAEAMTNLGNVLKDQGQWDEALDEYKRALKIYPRHAIVLNNVGHVLAHLGQDVLAVSYLRKAIQADPGYADAFVNLGNALRNSDEERAIAAFRKALAINPQLPEAYNNLGALLEEQGRFDEARDALLEALRLRPDFGEAHRHLANLERHGEVTDHIRSMQALMESAATSDHDKIHIGFGLGKACEDIGEYARAIEFFNQANRLKRHTFSYSLDSDRRYFEALMAIFDAARLAGESSGIEDETPIFIVGMPRSGTSLVEQILASHPRVFGAGELEYLPRALDARCAKFAGGDKIECLQRLSRLGLRRIGSDYLKQLRAHDRKARFIVDKLPHNFLHVGLIRLALPRARIVHCLRDPIDTCLSVYKNYFTGYHPYAYDQQELGGYYRLYRALMAHWQAATGDAFYTIRYEDLIADPAQQIRSLLEYCDLEWDDACLAFHRNKRRVSTASSAQVRRPIYSDSVALWRHYEGGLGELISALRAPT